MTTPRWVNKKGIEIDFPSDVDTLYEALEIYGSIYDENQLKKLPPMIELPLYLSNTRVNILVLNASMEAASKRTKNELDKMLNSYDFECYGKQFYQIYSYRKKKKHYCIEQYNKIKNLRRINKNKK